MSSDGEENFDEEPRAASRAEVEAKVARSPSPPALAPVHAALLVIVSHFLERISFYGLAASVVLFAVRALRWTPGEAATLALVWQGVCYCSPLLSAPLADHALGRAPALLLLALPYSLGLALLVLAAAVGEGVVTGVAATPPALGGLFLVALGQVQVPTLSLGADQFEGEGETARASFFNWAFFAINLGALLAFSLVAWLAQEVSLRAALALTLGALLLATLLLALARSWGLRELPPSPPSSLLLAALRLLWRQRGHAASTLQLRAELAGYPAPRARELVRVVWALPVLGASVLFWALWAQTSSTFVAQGTVLDLRLGAWTIPVASLNVCNTLAVTLLTPLADRLVYPALRRRGCAPSPVTRMLGGALVIALAPLYAGLLELARRRVLAEGGRLAHELGDVAALSVLWQAPAYALVGVGEVLGAIAGTEFAYASVPRSHRATALALYWTASAIGTLLGGLLVATVTALGGWFGADLNAPEVHLERYFFLLAVLGLLNAAALALLRPHVPPPPEHDDDEQNPDTEHELTLMSTPPDL